jgi:small conductance mechanosensitive channel
MNTELIKSTTIATLTAVALKVVGALAIWVIGRWVISFALRLLSRSLERADIDRTLIRYLQATVAVLLNIALVVAILGFFGVETTTFAALIAACGLAIGVAWGGLLANFAAGAMLMVLRPFKVGDFVTAGGVTGTVDEIGLFVTTINTPDNVRTFVGNNKVFGDTIQNFSANPHRRVDLVAQLGHIVDPLDAIRRLRQRIESLPHVARTPKPDIEILQFNERGTLLAVRPYCSNEHYWDVYFATNQAIRQVFAEAGYPTPETAVVMRSAAGQREG